MAPGLEESRDVAREIVGDIANLWQGIWGPSSSMHDNPSQATPSDQASA